MIPEELEAYAALARQVKIEGDLVECGVYMGDSLSTIAKELPGRRVWAYDSFEGFPPGTPGKDDPVAREEGDGVRERVAERVLEPPLADDKAARVRADLLLDHSRVALDRADEPDCDLYESVRLALSVLGPRTVRGGIITVDDWTTFEGSRLACFDVLGHGFEPDGYFGPQKSAWWWA